MERTPNTRSSTPLEDGFQDRYGECGMTPDQARIVELSNKPANPAEEGFKDPHQQLEESFGLPVTNLGS